jgi:hypothetical protein
MHRIRALDLPQWLIDRFDYWTSWHDSCEPWRSRVGVDSELYLAYAMSLAVDLKRHLGEDYYVECNGIEVHDDRAYLLKVYGQQTHAEQSGTGQPATRPLSESEGSYIPQTEAEGRSR